MIIWRPIEEAPKGTGTTADPELLLWHKEYGQMRRWWPMQSEFGLQAGVTHFSEINAPPLPLPSRTCRCVIVSLTDDELKRIGSPDLDRIKVPTSKPATIRPPGGSTA